MTTFHLVKFATEFKNTKDDDLNVFVFNYSLYIFPSVLKLLPFRYVNYSSSVMTKIKKITKIFIGLINVFLSRLASI